MNINGLTEKILGNGTSLAREEILKHTLPWQAIKDIREIISRVAKNLSDDFEKIGEGVYVFRGVKISNGAEIIGPCIIDEGAEIRHGAYIRGNVIVGKGCVVGNSSEIKDSILFDGAAVPHFNYVGNSILGKEAHLGAGVIISNLKGDKSNVKIHFGDEIIDTGLRKFGAIVGARAEVGCGSVLNPGTLIFPNAQIYPLSSVRGAVPENAIYKSQDKIVPRT